MPQTPASPARTIDAGSGTGGAEPAISSEPPGPAPVGAIWYQNSYGNDVSCAWYRPVKKPVEEGVIQPKTLIPPAGVGLANSSATSFCPELNCAGRYSSYTDTCIPTIIAYDSMPSLAYVWGGRAPRAVAARLDSAIFPGVFLNP